MPRTKASRAASKQKQTSKLNNISEEAEHQDNGTKLYTSLEEFELEFAFRLKKYDKLLDDKLAALNRLKQKLKIKYSTLLASTLEPNNVMELTHDKENVNANEMQTSSDEKSAASSPQGKLGKQTRRSKQKDKVQTLLPYTTGTYQTPGISTGIPSLPPITPKVAMNTPISMLRLPRQGEMAFSLTGSPLMVTAMSHESKPNMNIPLNSQQVLSLIPHERLDPHCLPVLEEEAMEQLEALSKNLLTFINLTSSNAM